MTVTKKLLSVDLQENGNVVVLYEDGAKIYHSMEALEFAINQSAENASGLLELLLLMLYLQDGLVDKTVILDTLEPSSVVKIIG